jgi:hypothetical protein
MQAALNTIWDLPTPGGTSSRGVVAFTALRIRVRVWDELGGAHKTETGFKVDYFTLSRPDGMSGFTIKLHHNSRPAAGGSSKRNRFPAAIAARYLWRTRRLWRQTGACFQRGSQGLWSSTCPRPGGEEAIGVDTQIYQIEHGQRVSRA